MTLVMWCGLSREALEANIFADGRKDATGIHRLFGAVTTPQFPFEAGAVTVLLMGDEAQGGSVASPSRTAHGRQWGGPPGSVAGPTQSFPLFLPGARASCPWGTALALGSPLAGDGDAHQGDATHRYSPASFFQHHAATSTNSRSSPPLGTGTADTPSGPAQDMAVGKRPG